VCSIREIQSEKATACAAGGARTRDDANAPGVTVLSRARRALAFEALERRDANASARESAANQARARGSAGTWEAVGLFMFFLLR